MSSKAASAVPTGPRPARARSMTARLVMLYTLATTALFLAGGGLLYFAVVQQVNGEDETFLADKLKTLRAALGEPTGEEGAVLREEVQVGAGPRQLVEYYARILEASGQPLLETPGMTPALPASAFPVAPADLPAPIKRATMEDGRTFLLTSVHSPSGVSGEARLVQAALDCSDDERLFAWFRLKLGAVALGGAVLSAAIGTWVARRSLRPLREITRQVEQVGALRLRERIGTRSWPGELTALAAAFDGMLQRLDNAFARLSQLSADVAHELRTPLANLRGEAEVALAKRRHPREYRAVLESALEEYNRLGSLIDGLLFLARAESAEVVLTRVCVEARREAEAVIEYHEAVATEKGIALTCAGHATLEADPLLLRRALSNLVVNALRHTPGGGTVQVGIERGSEGGTQVTVCDTGEGIAPEDLPRIFDRFYRANPARSGGADGEQGSGLGLAIVQSIMELHGGVVEARSTPGAGAAFTLRFPAQPLPSPR